MDANGWVVLATVLTALFTGWAVVQHIVDRKRAMFRVVINDVRSREDGFATYGVLLVNVGDGDALDVSFRAPDKERFEERKARLANGECMEVWVKVPNPAIVSGVWNAEDGYIGLFSEAAKVPEDCNEVLEVIWHQPPYRALARRKRYRLRDLELSPKFDGRP